MWFTIPTVVRTGLNLCIFSIFDHTCSGLKKSKFLWVFACYLLYLFGWKKSKFWCTNVPRTCSFVSTCLIIPAVVWKSLNFLHVFTISTVVEKGLNLCIFDMFDHTCSGLKMSKLLCTNVPRICSYLLCSFSTCGLPYLQCWKRSKFVYFGHVWPYLQWSQNV